MSKKDLVVWFDSNGDMLEQGYGGTGVNNTYGYKSEPAKDFTDIMKVLRIKEYRKRNARVVLQSTTNGRKYSMFIDEFNKVIEWNRLQNQHIEGTFRFLKRSSGQAVELLEEKP